MHSQWFLIAEAVGQRLLAVAQGLTGVQYLHNPPLPLEAQQPGAQVLFVLVRGDRALDQPGQEREKRRARLVVGAVSLTDSGLADADSLLFAARIAMRASVLRVALRAVGDVAAIREVEVEPEVNDVAVQGSVLMSAFEIDYFQTYPAA